LREQRPVVIDIRYLKQLEIMNKKILKYVEDKGWDLNHDVDGLAFAAERTANLFSDVTPMRVIKSHGLCFGFLFIISNCFK